MGFFGIGKNKGRTIDLTSGYREQNRRPEPRQEMPETNTRENALGFLGNLASASPSSQNQDEGEYRDMNLEANPEDRKRKLARRLMDMTEKIEDLTNQIYHLQQRIEVLERKSGI